MPIFLDPVARRRAERDRRVRRRRQATLVVLAAIAALIGTAAGCASRAPRVQPPYDVPAAAVAERPATKALTTPTRSSAR